MRKKRPGNTIYRLVNRLELSNPKQSPDNWYTWDSLANYMESTAMWIRMRLHAAGAESEPLFQGEIADLYLKFLKNPDARLTS